MEAFISMYDLRITTLIIGLHILYLICLNYNQQCSLTIEYGGKTKRSWKASLKGGLLWNN